MTSPKITPISPRRWRPSRTRQAAFLLIGVAQDKETGGPSDVVGVDGGENALVERVQQIALRHVFPALPIEAKAITIPDGQPAAGRRVVIARIHESPQAPHAMVDTNAIYVRTGDISHPEKFPELRWLEHLQERRRTPEKNRLQLWDESVTLAEVYASAEASKSIWWFILASCPTYPHVQLKPEREVKRIMDALIGDSIPCPGGVARRQPFPVPNVGRGIDFIRCHQPGLMFWARAFPSSFEPPGGDWLADLVAKAWRLGADVLRKLQWSGHVSVLAELNHVRGKKLDPTVAMQSVVDRVTAEEQVLARDMLEPEQGVWAAARLLDRLIWGMGHSGYGIDETRRWMGQKLKSGG